MVGLFTCRVKGLGAKNPGILLCGLRVLRVSKAFSRLSLTYHNFAGAPFGGAGRRAGDGESAFPADALEVTAAPER